MRALITETERRSPETFPVLSGEVCMDTGGAAVGI